jgi:hypothetical protein
MSEGARSELLPGDPAGFLDGMACPPPEADRHPRGSALIQTLDDPAVRATAPLPPTAPGGPAPKPARARDARKRTER